MGASGWWYVVPFQKDVSAALDTLRHVGRRPRLPSRRRNSEIPRGHPVALADVATHKSSSRHTGLLVSLLAAKRPSHLVPSFQ